MTDNIVEPESASTEPCPVCGSPTHVRPCGKGGRNGYVMCSTCGLTSGWEDTWEFAVTRWNQGIAAFKERVKEGEA